MFKKQYKVKLLWKVLFLILNTLFIVGNKINSSCRYYGWLDILSAYNKCATHSYLNIPEEKSVYMFDLLETETISMSDNNNRSIFGMYRPRSALARALYEKQRNDEELRRVDKNEWYRIEDERLSSGLKDKFVQLSPDTETRDFISQSIEKSSWIWTQLWHILAKAFLRHFWSITDINGWLQRGSMFVLSENQVKELLCPAGESSCGVMIDIGAGDGEVCLRWRNLFRQQYATEISASMRSLLASKGFKIMDADSWYHEPNKYDTVCMLNLLDRCSKPVTMLRQAKQALRPAGVIMIALVLPYKPYVEVTPDHKPEEKLDIRGKSFEEQVTSFVEFMASEMNLELIRWTRVPYLCEGDFSQSYYWLNDSVYVFRNRGME